jgi:hypothetical protein
MSRRGRQRKQEEGGRKKLVGKVKKEVSNVRSDVKWPTNAKTFFSRNIFAGTNAYMYVCISPHINPTNNVY